MGRLSRLAGINLLPTFMVGAALLVLADFTAGRLLSPFQIPVGLISSALGGLYLMWLLGMGGRRRA
nr:iron chelate uptake ABC transporter family permease subunit [Arachnia propionica]